MLDLVLRNGLVVTQSETLKAELAVRNGKIIALGSYGSFNGARREYDADGKLILPGLVDPHVHMAHPFRGELSEDDFYSTTVSAAFGGTTTIIDFAIQWDKQRSLRETVELRKEQIEGEIAVDCALHAVPTKSTQETLTEARYLMNHGVTSFKAYMVYREQGRMVDDAILYGLLAELRHQDGTLMVHAENSAIAEYNQKLFLQQGRDRAADFPDAKPNVVEAEAVNRVLYLNNAAGGRLYIVHLSTREGLALVEAAKSRGNVVFAETCPHYLVLSNEAYRRNDGHRFICSPPLRAKADLEALWQGVARGSISTISSDHCGFGERQKDKGQGSFVDTPHGLPGVEARLPLVYTEGVLKGRITANHMVELLSTNPAKIFGLYPQKGALLPGSDADIVIIDPEEQRLFKGEDQHGAVKWSPFEGMELRGFAQTTFLKGKAIVHEGNFLGKKGEGRYLARSGLDTVPMDGPNL